MPIIIGGTLSEDSGDNSAQEQYGWNDNIQWFSSARGRGTSEPTWADMGNGHYGYSFGAGDELFVHFHVLHDYKIGTKGYPHIHFLVDEQLQTGQQVTWRFGYVIAKGHSQGESLLGTETVFDMTYTATGLEPIGDHLILECSDVQAFDLIEPDTIIIARVDLVSDNVTGNIFGLMCDLHYQTDRHSTLNKSPDFYN